MAKSSIRFSTFPQTEPPPAFVPQIVSVFEKQESYIATLTLSKGLNSDEVLSVLRADLIGIGFDVERGKRKDQKSSAPYFTVRMVSRRFVIKLMLIILRGNVLLK